MDAIHVTISYHENFRETVLNFEKWNHWFQLYPDLIMPGYDAQDIDIAKNLNKTAVFFGFQNPSPIEDDIGLVEIVHKLGARFMQLTYNNQSLLASGCYEDTATCDQVRTILTERIPAFGYCCDAPLQCCGEVIFLVTPTQH